MIITRRIRVSAETYYKYLVEMVLRELRKNMSGAIKKEELVKGFKTRKTFYKGKEKVETIFTIEEMTYPELLVISVTTDKGTQFTSHSLRPIKDDVVEDTYEEDLRTDDLKMKLSAIWNAGRTRSNMAKNIARMEKELLGKK